MRSRTSHAAKSGVGEHRARESESAQRCATGKSAWRAPTPKFGPGTARFRGLIVFGDPREGTGFASRTGQGAAFSGFFFGFGSSGMILFMNSSKSGTVKAVSPCWGL